jgi:hypothetical protein
VKRDILCKAEVEGRTKRVINRANKNVEKRCKLEKIKKTVEARRSGAQL